jgi:hypothetical protein
MRDESGGMRDESGDLRIDLLIHFFIDSLIQ